MHYVAANTNNFSALKLNSTVIVTFYFKLTDEGSRILQLIGITTIIYTELVPMLLATASVAQLAEHRTRFVRSRVRFPAGWPNVAFFSQQVPVGS